MPEPTVIILRIRRWYDPRGWLSRTRLRFRYWQMRYRFVMGHCTRCGFKYHKAGQTVCQPCLDQQVRAIERTKRALDKRVNRE